MLYIEAEVKPKILYIEADTNALKLKKERHMEFFNIINYVSIFVYPLAILIFIGGIYGLSKELNDNNIIGGIILCIVCFLSLLSLLVNYIFKKYDYSLYILYVN